MFAPTSALASVYEESDAPAIGAHEVEQRCHAKLYDWTWPVQLPVATVSVCPCTAVPETVGAEEFWGAPGFGFGLAEAPVPIAAATASAKMMKM